MTKRELIDLLNATDGNPELEGNHSVVEIYGIGDDNRRPFLIAVIEASRKTKSYGSMND